MKRFALEINREKGNLFTFAPLVTDIEDLKKYIIAKTENVNSEFVAGDRALCS